MLQTIVIFDVWAPLTLRRYCYKQLSIYPLCSSQFIHSSVAVCYKWPRWSHPSIMCHSMATWQTCCADQKYFCPLSFRDSAIAFGRRLCWLSGLHTVCFNMHYYDLLFLQTMQCLRHHHSLLSVIAGLVCWTLWHWAGEANIAYNRDLYKCTFPAMIGDWREKWHNATDANTSLLFPFGFVQVWTPSFSSIVHVLFTEKSGLRSHTIGQICFVAW